jgi:hypothetical protein
MKQIFDDKDTASLSGRLTLQVFRMIHGEKILIACYDSDNLITISGLQLVTFLLSGEPGNNKVTKVGVGDGTDPTHKSDVGLSNAYIKDIDYYTFNAENIINYKISMDTGDGNGLNISEFGLFSGDEQLFARRIQTPVIPKDSDIIIEGNWTVSIFQCKTWDFAFYPQIRHIITSKIDAPSLDFYHPASQANIVSDITDPALEQILPLLFESQADIVLSANSPSASQVWAPPDYEPGSDPLRLGWEWWDQAAVDEDAAIVLGGASRQISGYTDDTERRSQYRPSNWRFENATDFEITMTFYYASMTGGFQGEGPHIGFGYTNGQGGSSDFAEIILQQSPWFGLRYQGRTEESIGTIYPALGALGGALKIKYEHLAGTGGKSKVTLWYMEDQSWEWDGDSDGQILNSSPIAGTPVFPFIQFGNKQGRAEDLWWFDFNVISGSTIAYP